ncbi:hypothetical protein [Rhizobium leguminosarum]|uniref:Uncharacterized protein n=1 Tax=Rhizobium leguminosarum TaxID=384 RepID=A0A6P0B9B4_RHILE|nr:hypothetical protein [Rhizobium leguminosarum]MBY5440934.1 hypothetical protein [Rhizobium leguminosarum]NEI36315.1 hypothetical protein [Rhizobium leguminosarum]NEI45586.1 hypothetical protein [Rhizobium leguminosarum]
MGAIVYNVSWRLLFSIVFLLFSNGGHADPLWPGPRAPSQTETVDCSEYAAIGIARCSKALCFSSGNGRGLVDSQLKITKSDEEGIERACYVSFNGYLPFPWRQNPSFPRQFCIVAKAESQTGIDRKAAVRCTVTIPRFELQFSQKYPPSAGPYDYTGKFNGVFPFSFVDSFPELTIALPFSVLESEFNAQKGGGFFLFSWKVANAHLSVHQSNTGERFRQRFDLSLDVNLRGVEDVDCKVKAGLSIPASPVTAGTKVGVLIQGADSTCDATGFFAHAFGLDALMSGAIRSALASQAVGLVGAVVNEEDFNDWVVDDPRLKTLLEQAWIGGTLCEAPFPPGICLKVSWRERSLGDHRNAVLASAPPATSPADVTGLAELREEFRKISPRMPLISDPNGYAFPAKRTAGAYDDGDMAIFGGLLCLSGENEGCELVRRSQGREGQFWRSPARANSDTDDQFSGDQFKGVAAFWARTGNAKSLESYLDRVSAKWTPYPSKATNLVRMYNGCKDDPGGKCNIIDEEWRWLNIFANRYGAASHVPVDARDYIGKFGDPVGMLPWKAMINKLGYRAHLVAVEIYISKKLGIHDPRIDVAAEILAGRQPDNPFFLFLARGKDARVAQLVRQKCVVDTGKSEWNQWSWERAESGQAWKQSMGWDCIFMINNLLD